MKKIIFIILITCFFRGFSNKIEKAYVALEVYDYFKAKQLFSQSVSEYPTEASFGLATIFYRSDNPFSNIDSAAKYISICKNTFKQEISFSKFRIHTFSIDSLTSKISSKGFEKHVRLDNIKAIEHFLVQFYFSEKLFLERSYHIRDSLFYRSVISYRSSDSIQAFLLHYPQTDLYASAKQDYYTIQYHEVVNDSSFVQLKRFLKYYPANPNKLDAEKILFEQTKNLHAKDSLYSFIRFYSTKATSEAAWKTLYSMSVKKYDKQDLAEFLIDYPEYPYNETVLKEIALSQKTLIPFKTIDEKMGYVDTLGNWIIAAQYDDAINFSEGLASVSKNDSCFYINKEGNILTHIYFDEADSYKNGLAIVKKENLFFLINRSGQFISKGYNDISESSDNLFVCKLNELYGAINEKGEIIIPFTYSKLGNFKNGYAYYLSKQYGLVSTKNKALIARWDWISDVDSNQVAVVKKDTKYGIINTVDNLILETNYDYITPCQNGIYLIMKNNLYGFFDIKEKCFVTSISYNYSVSYKPSYYTNGKYFRLIKDNEVALVDANGRYSINFGQYTNLFFAKCDMIRIQKNNKYGFVDRKLKSVTPVEFDYATDFENDVAVVKKANTSMLIDKQNKSLFTLKDGNIIMVNSSLYLVDQDILFGLINKDGKTLLGIEYDSIDYVSHNCYRCVKNQELFIFNSSTQRLKKL